MRRNGAAVLGATIVAGWGRLAHSRQSARPSLPASSKPKRSRKRRTRRSGAPATIDAGETGGAAAGRAAVDRSRGDSSRAGDARGSSNGAPMPVSRRYGQRPRPPWHPLPLSELLILAGAVGLIIGMRRGISAGGSAMLAGIVAVALGTLEVSIREHRSGHRSHTIMLAALPVLIFHSGVILLLSLITHVPPLLNLGLLAVDLALFALLFRLLRAGFLAARGRVAMRRWDVGA